MATRSPTPDHSYWGSFNDSSGLPSGDPRLEPGDTAYAEQEASLYVFDGAAWQAVGGGGGTIGGTIAANEVAFGTAPDAIGGSPQLEWNPGTSTFSVYDAGVLPAMQVDAASKTTTLTGDANPVLVLVDEILSAPFFTATPVTRELALTDPTTLTDTTVITPTDVAVNNGSQTGNLAGGQARVSDSGTGNTLAVRIPAGLATLASEDGASVPQPLDVVVGELQINGAPGAFAEVLTSQGAGNAPVWAAVPATAPAGLPGEIQYNNGSFAGAAHASIDDGDLVVGEHVVGVIPPSYTVGVKLVAQPMAQREMLVVATQGWNYFTQPHLGKTKIGSWIAYGNNTVLPIGNGMPAPSNTVTLTTRTVASTNFVTALRRIGIVGTTAAGNNCGLYLNTLLFLRGTTVTMGGFHFVIRFVVADSGAITQGANGVGMFVGLCGTTTALNSTNSQSVGGSGVLNSIGLGVDYADSQMTFMYNGSSGTATKVVLNGGTGFPANGQSTDAYELSMFAPPGSNIVYWAVTNLVTGASDSGSASGAKLVAQTQTLAIQMMKFNQAAAGNAPAAAPGLDFVSAYIESGY